MRLRSVLWCAATLSLCAVAAAQEASPEPIVLRWSAPEGCPDKAAVAARIEKLIGGPPRPTGLRFEASGAMEGSAGAFRLEVAIASGTSESKRILQGASCSSLSDAGALVIALAFDPEAVAAQQSKGAGAPSGSGAPSDSPAPSGSASPSEVAPPSEAAPPPTAPALPAPSALVAAPPPTAAIRIPVPWPPPPIAPPAPPRSRVSLGAFAELTADAGSLPSVAPGVRAGLSLGIGAFRIEPSFEAWPSSKSTLADRPDAGADLRLLAFALGACRRVLPWSEEGRRIAAFGCLGVEVGEMRGDGFGVGVPGSGSALWIAPWIEARGELSLTSWAALRLDLGLAVPVDPPRFVLDLSAGRAVVHQPSAAVGRAGLGIEARY